MLLDAQPRGFDRCCGILLCLCVVLKVSKFVREVDLTLNVK